jgi:hypothetical protein
LYKPRLHRSSGRDGYELGCFRLCSDEGGKCRAFVTSSSTKAVAATDIATLIVRIAAAGTPEAKAEPLKQQRRDGPNENRRKQTNETDKRPGFERPLTGVGAINFAMITSRNQKTNENNNCYLHYSTNP